MNPNITYIPRDIEKDILGSLNQGKVIIIYGPRRVGKTTLVKHVFEKEDQKYLYLDCEQNRIKNQLVPDELRLKEVISDYKNIVLDEAQYLDNPGLVLKVLIDTFPHLNVLVSGSSSFELAGKVTEPLTGRSLHYYLLPFTWGELYQIYGPINSDFYIEQTLRFGSYPEVLQYVANDEKVNYLQLLAQDYLYKDILAFERVKDSKKLRDLLTALSLQLGSEVSYNELANILGIDRKTVEYYLDLLEKTFVIFRLYPFSRNLRSEINRKVKIYFYDTGIRNALINNFNDMDLRSDKGGIFENFAISEIIKQNKNKLNKSNFYFWRTYQQKEIDLIEEKGGKLSGYEFKYGEGQKIPKATVAEFQKAYPGSKIKIVTRDNFTDTLKSLAD